MSPMMRGGRGLWVLVGALCLSACSVLDNYWLGKDNTIMPSALPEIKALYHFKLLWTHAIGAVSSKAQDLYVQPAARGGRVWVASTQGDIFAFHAKDGRVIWTQKTHEVTTVGPVLGDGLVFVGTASGSIFALDAATGHIRWQRKLKGDVFAKPVLVSGTLIVKTVDGHLYNLDARTGNKRWRVDHGGPHVSLRASASPVVQDNTIYATYADGHLEAVDLATGQVKWNRSVTYATNTGLLEGMADIDATPIIRGSTIYIASYQGLLGAFSLEDGHFLWQKSVSVYKNMLLEGQSLYFIDSADTLWAYDTQQGRVLWKQEALKARAVTSPVRLGNALLLGDKTGYLHVVSREDGALLGRTMVTGPILSAATTVGNIAFVQSSNGVVSAYRVQP
ncbi:MAG: outer membrane protein assembly factor BamB [Legionellaceae bacterium]|nr:outer membrane protein assembly factor BamB [Legionellaceae bacterium]